MTDLSGQIALAIGHNNAAGLIGLADLNPPFFAAYRSNILLATIEWHGYETRELAASKRFKKVGRPWCLVTLPYLMECEYDYLRAAGYLSERDVLVTARLFDKFNRAWNNYNARLILLDDYRDEIDLYDVHLEFRELELI